MNTVFVTNASTVWCGNNNNIYAAQIFNDIWKTSDGMRWSVVMANEADESFPKVRIVARF